MGGCMGRGWVPRDGGCCIGRFRLDEDEGSG